MQQIPKISWLIKNQEEHFHTHVHPIKNEAPCKSVIIGFLQLNIMDLDLKLVNLQINNQSDYKTAGKTVAYTSYFKIQVIEYTNEGHTAYYAATHFQPETRYIMILQCFVNGTGRKISSVRRALKIRLSGGGRKPALGNTGDLQADEIIELRI